MRNVFCRTGVRSAAKSWLAALTVSLCGPAVQAAPPSSFSSVAFWYAAKPPLSQLARFDWAVVESGHLSAADVSALRQRGGLPFAYLSVGEFHGGQAELADAALADAVSPVRNSAWNSQVMNLEAPVWREHLLRRAETLRAQGYAGLFLDTLDSFQLLPEAAREAQRLALVDFVRELHQRQPSLKLFFNRGFEVLPDLEGLPAAVAVESIHSGWDASTQRYRPVPEADRQWLESKLQPLRAQGIPVVAIDYLPTERRKQARALARQLRQEGFVPYIGTPDLGSMGISSPDASDEAGQ